MTDKKIKALIFDFGGTLDTDGTHWSEVFREAYQRFVINVTKDSFNNAYVYAEDLMKNSVVKSDTFLTTLNKQISFQFEYLLKNKLMNESNIEKMKNDLTEYCYSQVTETIPSVKSILKSLHQNYQLALVSNFYGNINTVLNELSIHQYFNSIVDSFDVNVRKPDPKIFQIAIDELGIMPYESVVIGDSYDRDIVPAKILGCKTIWLKGKSWTDAKDISSADKIISSISGLKNVINSFFKEDKK